MLLSIVFMGGAAREGWAADGKYPTKPIQIVIGFQPGTTDMIIRPFVEKFPEYLGQPVVFVYKPGAMSSIGASFVAKSKPDGYTLLGCSQTTVITPPLTMEGVGYTFGDLVPICSLAKAPALVVIKADSPWKTIKDIVEEAKKSPGKLSYSTSGAFSGSNLSMEVFLKLAGVNITHVPCQGSTPAVTALLGGHVNMTCTALDPVSAQVKAGTLRIIGFFENERVKEFPDVPTFSESGYPVIYVVWTMLLAPKGTSEEVVRTINKTVEKVIQDHKQFIEDRLEKLALKLDFLKSEEAINRLKADNDLWGKTIKELKKSSN